MDEQKLSYIAHSLRQPNSLDGMFKPLPDYVEADIKAVLDVLSLPDSVSALAFNRLITELHIATENSRDALQTAEAYRPDLNAIDKMLEAAGMNEGATVTSVKKFIERNAKVQKSYGTGFRSCLWEGPIT